MIVLQDWAESDAGKSGKDFIVISEAVGNEFFGTASTMKNKEAKDIYTVLGGQFNEKEVGYKTKTVPALNYIIVSFTLILYFRRSRIT